MATPVVYNFPAKRPGFIETAQWVGPDDDLELEMKYTDVGGVSRLFKLTTSNTNEGRTGDCCLSTAKDVNDLRRDLIIASVRMATFISHTVAGSLEWTKSFVEQEGSQDFQLPVGTAAITNVNILDDVNVAFDIKRKGNNPSVTIATDHGELSNYTFTPSTQLYVVGGAIKVQFPSYVHEYPGTILTTQERNDIADYVVTLDPWI